MSLKRTLSLCAASAVLCSISLLAQDVAPDARITSRIDENQLVTLSGNTHPAARVLNDRGPVSGEMRMDGLVLVLARSPERQAAFDKYTASLYDPASPNYHKWLDASEIGERFGPAPGDIGIVQDWLRSHGLNVGQVANDRMTIEFGGTAAQVESTFHTQIHNLEVKGVKHFANMSDPQIPAALAPVVVGPKALHNFIPRPLNRLGSRVRFNKKTGHWERIPPQTDAERAAEPVRARPLMGILDPNNNGYEVEDVTPSDLAAIYNILPVWNKGNKGAGQTIAIAGTSDIETSDVATFRSAFGLPAIPSFKTIVANGIDPGVCTDTTGTQPCGIGDLTENSLDVEYSGAVAPGADIVLVVSGQNSSDSIDTIYASSNYVVQNKTAWILNVSYGLCELGEGTAGNTTYNDMWQTAYNEGIAVFVATGDSGSAACDDGGDDGGSNVPYAAEYGVSVSGIASTPYNVAVGGTDLLWCDPVKNACTSGSPYWGSSNNSTTQANALGYIPEIPWNSTCVSPIGIELMQYFAQQESATVPSDAEESCNFAAVWAGQIENDFGVNTAAFVDTVGGSGGVSNCTVNATTSTTVGAVSSCSGGYAKPSWQVSVEGISGSKREIPDISFFASNGFLDSAYLICVSANGACTYSDTSENTAQEVGGTSAASPVMAGVMALINESSGAPQGNPNTELYTLAKKQNYADCSAETVKTSSSCYFNDIDKQTNAQVCDYGGIEQISPDCSVIHSGDQLGVLPGYGANAGYDAATGLGSLNVANVVNAWPVADVPIVSVSSTQLTYASTVVGVASAAQAITLSDTGKATLTLASSGKGITITGADASSFSETTTCGATLAASAHCTISVTFKPVATGALAATLNITDNANGSPQNVALMGTAVAPAVTLSATGLGFGAISVGGSATNQVKLTNSGNAAMALSGTGHGISITGTDASSFSETNNCPSSLAVGKNCLIDVTFSPKTAGNLSASLTIASNAPGSAAKVALTGTGEGGAPGAVLNHTSLTFAATKVGVSTAEQSVTLTNSGGSSLSLSGSGHGVKIAGTDASSFSETNNCGTSLAGGKSCTIKVTFKPAASGALTASVEITDNASGSPQGIKLTGTGDAAEVSVSKTSLTFASTTEGDTAAKQTVTLTNKGNASLGLSGTGAGRGIAITGTDASSFSETNTCGSGIAAGKSCTITIAFKPKAAGTLTADVAITDNAPASPQKIALKGTGAGPAADFSKTSVTFTSTIVDDTAAKQTVTLTNKGNKSLGLAGTGKGRGIAITGTDASSFSETNTCGSGLKEGASCTITVTFRPKAAGTLTADLAITDNAPASPQKIELKGTGDTAKAGN